MKWRSSHHAGTYATEPYERRDIARPGLKYYPTALRAPLRAVDALWGHCYTTPHRDNAGESLGVDDTEAAMVIACAVVKYQAPSAGGARDMVSAGKPGTLRRPRISRRGHDIGGGCPPQVCADQGWEGRGPPAR